MPECKICGRETRKERLVCKGCYSTKKVAKNKTKASDTNFFIAQKHLTDNPNLLSIAWGSFTKKL